MSQRAQRSQNTSNYRKTVNNTDDSDDESDSDILARIAATQLPDELYHVIREIVPPPPPAQAHLISSEYSIAAGTSAPPEKLFSRRSSEDSLLEKVRNQSSSAEEARINLEELFFQIIEPNKCTDEGAVMQSVLNVMQQWPREEAIQEQALGCFMCLRQQRSSSLPSLKAVQIILDAMKYFLRNEKIQRNGAKVLSIKKILCAIDVRVDIACVLCKSLCELPHVDDFVVYVKIVVNEMTYEERVSLRKHQPFVEMLLNFPYRKDVLIHLSWCALDTLILLTVSNDRWETLIGFQTKIERLSERPEFEDRCRILLKQVELTSNKNVNNFMGSPERILNGAVRLPTQRQLMTSGCQLTDFSAKCHQSSSGIDSPSHGLIPSGPNSTLWSKMTCTYQSSMLPVESLVSRRPPTPPSTVGDLEEHDGRLISDDEIDPAGFTPQSSLRSYTPTRTPSPSYSPNSKGSACIDEENRELFSPTPTIGNGNSYEKETFGMHKSLDRNNDHQPKVVKSVGCDSAYRPTSNGKVAPVFPCFICRERKAKQPLIMKQFNQISHCLLLPCNKLLLKCLQSNVCQDHKLT